MGPNQKGEHPMEFIILYLLPALAVCLVLHLLAKRRADRLMKEAEAEERRQAALFTVMTEHLGSRRINTTGRVFSHGEAKIEMERRKREARKWCDERDDSDDIMNPLHPLSPLNPVGPLNMSNLSSSSDDSHRPHSSQACYTGSDPHESSRHSSGSDWGSSSSSDSSSYSSSDSGSSSSSCD